MRKIALAIGLVMALAALVSAQSAKPDFSGTWNIDLAKSDFGPVPAPDSLVLVIVHKDPSIKVTSTQKGGQGDSVNTRTLTTDGKDNVNTMHAGDSGDQQVTSTTTWSDKKLLTAATFDTQGVTIGMNDSWELSADGKVLTILRELKTPDGTFTLKTVYNKQ